ncbi:MAG: hypothetical protein J3Q66DRAFT_68384, partial [Benniella sp.]
PSEHLALLSLSLLLLLTVVTLFFSVVAPARPPPPVHSFLILIQPLLNACFSYFLPPRVGFSARCEFDLHLLSITPPSRHPTQTLLRPSILGRYTSFRAQTRSPPVDAMSSQFSDPLAQEMATSANPRPNPASSPPGLYISWHDSYQQDTVASVPTQLAQFIPFPVDFGGSFMPVALVGQHTLGSGQSVLGNTQLHTTHHPSYEQRSIQPSYTSSLPGSQQALAVDLQSQTQQFYSMHGLIRFLQAFHSRQLQAANQHAYQQPQPQSQLQYQQQQLAQHATQQTEFSQAPPQYQQQQQIHAVQQTRFYQTSSQLQRQALSQQFSPMGYNLERSTPPGTTEQLSQSVEGQVLLRQSTHQENTNLRLTSEPAPSSLHEAVPAKRDYNRKQVECQDRVQDGSQPKAKRNRKNYTPEERLEIKKYRDENPEKSFKEIGDKFNAPKTSVFNILRKMTP